MSYSNEMEISIEDFLSAREEALTREELIHIHASYLKEISSLQARISETNLKIELTDRELSKSATFVDQVGADKIKVYRSLLEENKMLKKMHAENFELKMQAQLTQNLKELFKKKYEEAIVGFTSNDPLTDTSDQSNAAEIEGLQQRLIDIELQVAEVIKDKDYIKKKVIPVLENTLKLYEKNKKECEERIEELKADLRNRIKRTETHSASPVSSKSNSAKNLHSIKTEAAKLPVKAQKPKAYMPSYLSHSKPTIKRADRNSK